MSGTPVTNVHVKRVYEPVADADGLRILVDRLWPRGLSKEAARVDEWTKEVAPSHALRGWFDHDPDKWDEFQRRFALELALVPDAITHLRTLARRGPVTLLFASKEPTFNNANALRAVLTRPARAPRSRRRR